MAVVDIDLQEIYEEAFEMAGSQFMTGYDIRQARRALNFVVDEWTNRGLNLFTVDSATISCVSGTETYALPASTIDLIDQVIRSTDGLTDYTIERLPVGDYSKLSKKQQTGRPTTIYVERINAPQVTLWPIPDAAYTLVYWKLNRIDGQSSGVTGSTNVPSRFRPALCAGIAKRIAMVKNRVDLIPILAAEYESQYAMAAGEDRDRASYSAVPYVRRI